MKAEINNSSVQTFNIHENFKKMYQGISDRNIFGTDSEQYIQCAHCARVGIGGISLQRIHEETFWKTPVLFTRLRIF